MGACVDERQDGMRAHPRRTLRKPGEGVAIQGTRHGHHVRELVPSTKRQVELAGGQSSGRRIRALGERDDPLGELTRRAVGCVVHHALR